MFIFIVQVGDSTVTTAAIEGYMLFPLPSSNALLVNSNKA